VSIQHSLCSCLVQYTTMSQKGPGSPSISFYRPYVKSLRDFQPHENDRGRAVGMLLGLIGYGKPPPPNENMEETYTYIPTSARKRKEVSDRPAVLFTCFRCYLPWGRVAGLVSSKTYRTYRDTLLNHRVGSGQAESGRCGFRIKIQERLGRERVVSCRVREALIHT